MAGLERRVRALEKRERELNSGRQEIRMFLWGELEDCQQHSGCMVERATGEHHGNVIRLTFGDRP